MRNEMTKQYTTKEVQDLLQISKDTWKRRKEEILEYLEKYWEYEVKQEGRRNIFIVQEEYSELQPLPRKSKTEEMEKFYAGETDNIIQHNPWNTGANIAREITATNNKYNHAEGTAANYVRPILKADYIIAEAKEWRKPNYSTFVYEEMSSEELEYLSYVFEKYLSQKNIIDTLAEEDAGYISKDVAYSCLKGMYNKAMDDFKQRYGYRPYKVGKYEKKCGRPLKRSL